MTEYFPLLARAWFGAGVERQVAAFRAACDQVVSVDKLRIFGTTELLELVCGEVVLGLGRVVALHCRSSTLYQVH